MSALRPILSLLLAALLAGPLLAVRPLRAEKGDPKPRPARSDGKPRSTTFDDIKFKMKKGDPFERSMLTKSIEEMDGQKIRIRGYILPSIKQSGITQFVLVRDNMECCFGPGAALYDCILVQMDPGKSIRYTVRPIAVEGVFSIRELKGPDGKHLAIYFMQGLEAK